MSESSIRIGTTQLYGNRQTAFPYCTAAQVEEMLQLDAVLRAGDVPVCYDVSCVQFLSKAQARNMIKIMKASKVKQAKKLLG
jgi:hypothetical protein